MAPKANIMRTEGRRHGGRRQPICRARPKLFATNNLIIPDPAEAQSQQGNSEIKFVIRRSPAHMGRAHGRADPGALGSTASSSSTP